MLEARPALELLEETVFPQRGHQRAALTTQIHSVFSSFSMMGRGRFTVVQSASPSPDSNQVNLALEDIMEVYRGGCMRFKRKR